MLDLVLKCFFTGILWVLWLASAAYSANQLGGFGFSCSSGLYADWWHTGCSETKAVTAFSFLIWIARQFANGSLRPHNNSNLDPR